MTVARTGAYDKVHVILLPDRGETKYIYVNAQTIFQKNGINNVKEGRNWLFFG